MFYDEELYPDSHVDFMKAVHASGRFEFHWVVVPLKSQKYILGKSYNYIQWDVSRQWVRQYPEFAETFLDSNPIDQKDVFYTYFRSKFKDSVVVCLGMRANESLNRLKSILVTVSLKNPHLKRRLNFHESCPVYDWQEKDIFKFIHDNKLAFSEVYNTQLWSGSNFRVATPLVSESSKHLDLLKVQSPEFYDSLMAVFPEMLVQERYQHEIDKDKMYEKYSFTEAGIKAYIEANLAGRFKSVAYAEVNRLFHFRATETLKPERGISLYPLYYIFYAVVNGTYKKYIPILPNSGITQKMRDYETPD